MAVAVTNDNLKMDWQLTKECMRDRIQTLLKTSQWSDCTFRVGENSDFEIFKAHRIILASSSPVFEAMFFGPLAEEQCVAIEDLEPDVFRILLEYIYADTVKLSSVEDAVGVLYASKKYMMPHLSLLCRNYILSNIRPSNVSSIFEFARSVQETDLLDPCIESPCDHISSTTLATLLDQKSLNITEVALFAAILRWAESKCQKLGLKSTGANLRAVLMKAGALSKIRFLVLSFEEFAKGPVASGILTEEEITALRYAIAEIDRKRIVSSYKDKDLPHYLKTPRTVTYTCYHPHTFVVEDIDFSLPNGISCSLEPRNRISITQFYCARKLLKTAVTVSGHLRLLTKVQVDRNITVSGIRFFTRLISQREFSYAPSFPRNYKENMEVCILDDQGELLCRTVYTEVVEYNTLATLTLSEPVPFANGKEYSILLALSCNGRPVHDYPLSFMSQTEKSHNIEFRFCDHADLNGRGTFVRRLDTGFVNTIVFSM
ncbi:hypothetical protein C0J52_11910 [Blattella germanica]|nr:hypothetical protein C0J52_11910 [Blattella germanica]